MLKPFTVFFVAHDRDNATHIGWVMHTMAIDAVNAELDAERFRRPRGWIETVLVTERHLEDSRPGNWEIIRHTEEI
jgi:hypothetical protein